MRRKLDLAMGLVGDPAIVFLDEPTTGLDPRSRRTMWEIVRGLVADGATIFLTTQYLDEADELADRIGVLDGGGSSPRGPPRSSSGSSPAPRCASPSATGGPRVRGRRADRGRDSPETLTLSVPSDGSLGSLRSVLRTLDDAALDPAHLAVDTPDLDDVFLALTGRPTDAAVEIS